MGAPIARNLAQAGMKVTAFSRHADRDSSLHDAGIRIAATTLEAIEEANTLILMLPGSKEIDQVLAREDSGRIGVPIKGKTVILMSTVAPSYSAALEHDIAAVGATYVEAPVSGSKKPAETGQLVVLASTKHEQDIVAVLPVFDVIGKRTISCGPVPNAMRMKLANNLLLITFFEAITEATYFARGIGLDVEQFLSMLQSGPLANDVLATKVPKLLADDFLQQAPIRHVFKDISLVCEEAERKGLWLPSASVSRDLYGTAMAHGQSNDDAIAVMKILRNGRPS